MHQSSEPGRRSAIVPGFSFVAKKEKVHKSPLISYLFDRQGMSLVGEDKKGDEEKNRIRFLPPLVRSPFKSVQKNAITRDLFLNDGKRSRITKKYSEFPTKGKTKVSLLY